MVDMTALTALHASSAATARAKSRRRSEVRLKMYGILAIGLAALALVTLLSSVFMKAAGALTEHYVALPVDFASDKVNQDDPSDGNYGGLMKDTLKEAFPYAKGRKIRRQLYGLVSSGASFELNDYAVDNPAVIGKSADFNFLLSDDADLYFKGFFGKLEERAIDGALTITGEVSEVGETVEITSTAEDFAGDLEILKARLLVEAKRVREDAARQENGRSVFAERAAAEADDKTREDMLATAEGYATQRDALIAKADDLELRGARPGGEEALSSETISLFIQANGGWIKAAKLSPSKITGEVLVPLTSAEASDSRLLVMPTSEDSRKVTDNQVVWLEKLRDRDAVTSVFNWRFFSSGDSREAELAGVWGAMVGTFWTMIVTFFLAFPIGVMAAIYLEEFAPKNRFTNFVEVNINNLAAVPSIVFGLLGLAIFVAGLEMEIWGTAFTIGGFAPRSAPIAGGMVLALMTLPTVIIASRAAIRAVPPSIRDAALGVGASKQQATFHHVLPLAMPGILTGSIIGMAQALGETAPLIMIGMVAFIVDIPQGVTDSASVLPVQIFRWSDFPERAFEAKTALTICVLLGFLLLMNIIAIILRKRFERRW